MQEPFRDLAAAYKNGDEFSLDASRFKAAGEEVIGLCEPLLQNGAGAETDVEAPTDIDTAPPADGGSYSSILDLQRAYIMAGGECSVLNQTNQITLAAESGDCNDTSVLSTYLSATDISELIQNNKALNEEIGFESDAVWLIGQNWIINSEDAAEVRKEMGGQLVSF